MFSLCMKNKSMLNMVTPMTVLLLLVIFFTYDSFGAARVTSRGGGAPVPVTSRGAITSRGKSTPDLRTPDLRWKQVNEKIDNKDFYAHEKERHDDLIKQVEEMRARIKNTKLFLHEMQNEPFLKNHGDHYGHHEMQNEPFLKNHGDHYGHDADVSTAASYKVKRQNTPSHLTPRVVDTPRETPRRATSMPKADQNKVHNIRRSATGLDILSGPIMDLPHRGAADGNKNNKMTFKPTPRRVQSAAGLRPDNLLRNGKINQQVQNYVRGAAVRADNFVPPLEEDEKEIINEWLENDKKAENNKKKNQDHLSRWQERYEVKQTLGSGSYGIAKLARRKADDAEVVLKFFPVVKRGEKLTTWKHFANADRNSNLRTTIVTARNECAWAKKIQEYKADYRSTQYFMDCYGTNIVALDAKAKPHPDDELYVELSYGGMPLDSLDVQRHLNLIKSPGTNGQNIMSQLTASLALLKKLKIVHHDLKPNNIMYDVKRELVTLIDFGAMSWESKAHLVPTFTIGYAPYQFENFITQKHPVTFDTFSMAGVFEYLFVGKNLLTPYVTIRTGKDPVTNWDKFDREVIKDDATFKAALSKQLYDHDLKSTTESATERINDLSALFPNFITTWREMLARDEGTRLQALGSLLKIFLTNTPYLNGT